MGEFVGVDPANLNELTKRLEQLHDLLARHSPLIRQKMEKWGSEVGTVSLPGLIAAALDDVRDMDARTTRAHELARQQGWSALGPAPGLPGLTFNRPPNVRLDWEATGQSGYQGKRDAETLTAALADKNPESTRIALSGLSERLQQHLADNDYQAAFWAGAGPLALRAARALYDTSGWRPVQRGERERTAGARGVPGRRQSDARRHGQGPPPVAARCYPRRPHRKLRPLVGRNAGEVRP